MDNGAFHRKIQLGLIDILYQQITPALWAESLAAICLTYVLWDAVSLPLLISWLAFTLVIGLMRHLSVFYYRRAYQSGKLTLHTSTKWKTIFLAGAFFSGLSWGIAASLLMVKNDMVRQTFSIFLLLGLTAGANSLYSSKREVFVAFIVPAFLPFMGWLFLNGLIFSLLGFLVFLYVVVMIGLSFHSHRLIYNSLFFRFENADLVDDLSAAKHILEKRTQDLFRKANFDSLTKLPNRSLLLERLRQEIVYADRSQIGLALFFLDLDRFKWINDTLGHTLGDKLLVEVAKRLQLVVNINDTVSREGGDEFVIILSSIKNEDDIIHIARRCLTAIREPYFIDGNKFNITISIGISFYPKDGEEPETLIKNADIAMYRAKELGRDNFQFFTEKMNQKVLSRMAIENQLRRALEEEELFLVYQPIMSLKNKTVVGVEALLRWNHPSLGELSPEEFISVTEESGLIIPIGEWVLKTACEQVKAWHVMGYTDLQIAVNLSARQFKQPDFFDAIVRILQQVELAPKYLAIELTESIIMDDVEANIQILNKLKALGIAILIDDFGVGYSSLNYLKRLPVDKLKIDKSFVKDIPERADDAAIIAAIIALASTLNLKVVAEGVETLQHVEFLVAHHCDEIQGFYYTEPLDVDDCTRFLRENKAWRVSIY